MSRKRTAWPTSEETLLLRAALFDGERAIDAWRSWHRAMAGARSEAASLRLFPLVYRNLHAWGADVEGLRQARVLYLATKRKNERIFSQLAGVLREFHRASIPTIILKGAVLAAEYYRDSGARPMDDVDLFVPSRHVYDSADVLYELGWRDKKRSIRAHVGHKHSAALANPRGFELDLHWHLMRDGCDEEADASFWSAAQRIEFRRVPALSLHPSDQLLHVCVHGLAWNFVSPIRWIPDALFVIRQSGGALDWERLLQRAEALHVVVPVREGLQYLSSAFEAEVPGMVLRRLQSLHTSTRQRWEFHSRVRDSSRSIFGQLPQHLFHFWRLHRRKPITDRFTRLLGYLRFVWRLESTTAVLPALVRKVARRVFVIGRKRTPPERPSEASAAADDKSYISGMPV